MNAIFKSSTAKPPANSGTTASSPAYIISGRVLIVLAICLAWEIAAITGYVDERFVGRPSQVLNALGRQIADNSIWPHLASTMMATLLAFTLGSLLGIIAGLTLAAFPTVDAMLNPVISGLNSIPRVALAPLFILWFGIGVEAKTVAGISLVFFILLITTRSGLKNADPDLLVMSRMMCASTSQTFLKVVLPISLPSIFSGLQLAVTYSLLGVVVAEMIASQNGLGVIVAQYTQTFAINETFSVLLILGVLSTTLAASVAAVERYVLSWQTP
ncbi:NitT/TauT family transport system permease protein [Polaromonas sp. OV174]|uniref:ABC transporter permease n=1 Tax=Polaromonas sp. OV174 TaxID=1855300 RepID=UPI0008E48AEF|nr:ABC transporter permease [Polaromonas sp. OV174]SFC21915.1 NitT/TauT family transport system permease protein [Polaromonas sp. OV174]